LCLHASRMPSGKKPVLRTVIAVITVSVIVSCNNETRRSPPVHAVKVSINDANVYMLDNPLGTVALYPGAFYRGMIESKYYMPSLEALEQRVARLPHGSKLRFSPYKRDHFGRPIIFATGEFA
jgi:hypothetical protein